MIILQAIAQTVEVWQWLLVQAPVIVVLGVVVYYQWLVNKDQRKEMKALCKAHREEISTKDERNVELANKALAVASLYDVKSDLNSKEHEKILILESEIRDIVRDIKNDQTKD